MDVPMCGDVDECENVWLYCTVRAMEGEVQQAD